MKPFAESSEQNKHAILNVLDQHLQPAKTILEIGAGTGQHAVFFAAQFPHVRWLASDLEENHPGIKAWVSESGLKNISGPIQLDVGHADWPDSRSLSNIGVDGVDVVFSANTLHIMDWTSVRAFFSGVGRVLQAGGEFCVYGPFNYGGNYTSESNARFDVWLKQRDPKSAIRHFEDLNTLAEAAGMALVEDYPMPANNRTLVWRKM